MSNEMSNENTANRWIKDVMDTLQLALEACRKVADDGLSWNGACRACGLNPGKTRAVALRLMHCNDRVPALENAGHEDIFDGYELFYNAAFGMKAAEQYRLPYDYKDAVKQVLDRIGQENTDILKRQFGICEYENSPMSFVEIAEVMGVSYDKVLRMSRKGMRECWSRENRELLRYGAKQYAARKKYQKECQEKELEQMAKRQESLRQWMLEQAGRTENEDDPFYTIFMECKETPIENLYRLLSARAVSALRRSSVFNRTSTAYDLIMMNIQELSSIKNIGVGTLSEILTMLDNYLDDRCGMSSAQLRKRIGNYIYKNTILNPEACGFCEHFSDEGCGLQEPCPYRD